jgi:hypothetical protein
MMHLLLAFLAGCGQGGPAQPAEHTAARSFQLIYGSNNAGEIEPCG